MRATAIRYKSLVTKLASWSGSSLILARLSIVPFASAIPKGIRRCSLRGGGACDLIRSGQNDFVVRTGDLDSLLTKLGWAFRRRDALAEMRFAARNNRRNDYRGANSVRQ